LIHRNVTSGGASIGGLKKILTSLSLAIFYGPRHKLCGNSTTEDESDRKRLSNWPAELS